MSETSTTKIASRLKALEEDLTLQQDTSFAARVAAADTVETQIIERLKLQPDLDAPAGVPRQLLRRARALLRRLEEADTRLFGGLESRIASGDCRGSALRSELIRLAGRLSRWEASGRDPTYDNLDLLVAGLLGTSAPPDESGRREPEMVPYQPTPARVILELIDRAGIGEDDLFYDLGSGLGQVPILVNLLTGARATGVETEPEYCVFARRRAQRLNAPEVQFINTDAREADYTEGTVFYLYTPFTGGMLSQVLNRLEAHAGHRGVRLVTFGPCTEQASLQGWLRCLDRVSGDPEFELSLFEATSVPPPGTVTTAAGHPSADPAGR